MDEFVSEQIEVSTGGEPQVPVSFVWRNTEFIVEEIEDAWHDYGFGRVPPRKRTWRLRRHRNYYRVLTSDGRRFVLYLDRSGGRRRWYLFKEVGERLGE